MKKNILLLLFLLITISFGDLRVTKLYGPVDFGMAYQVKRALRDMGAEDTVIFRINTNGGRIDAALDIADQIFASKCATTAFIEQKALSAGAMISVSCDSIVMTTGSTMGDCAPVTISDGSMEILGEKVQSPLRAKFRVYAQKGGYPLALAEAMVTPELVIYQIDNGDNTHDYIRAKDLPTLSEEVAATATIFVKDGELLTLSSTEAFESGFAKQIVDNFDSYAKKQNIDTEQLFARSWSEQFVSFIGVIAPLLLTIGMAGLYIETRTPGLGVAGIIGLLALSLAFGAQYMVGLADYTELSLLMVGLFLLAAEVFIIPGFGVVGVLGILFIASAGVLSLQDFTLPSPDLPWQDEIFRDNVQMILFALLQTVGLVVLFFLYIFPRLGRLVAGPILVDTLQTTNDIQKSSSCVGLVGVVTKRLHPIGQIEIDNRRHNALSADGIYIETGMRVTVIKHRGQNLVVRTSEER